MALVHAKGFASWIAILLCGSVVLASCGADTIARSRMAEIRERIEAMEDPEGFDRLGIEVVDPDSGILRHEGGFVVSWQPVAEVTADSLIESFVPVLRQAGYGVEVDEEQMCATNSLNLFLVQSDVPYGSARLQLVQGEATVRLLAGWDIRDRFLVDWIEDGPTCAELGANPGDQNESG